MGGIPQGDSVLVTKDGLAEIGRWIAAIYVWAETVSECVAPSTGGAQP